MTNKADKEEELYNVHVSCLSCPRPSREGGLDPPPPDQNPRKQKRQDKEIDNQKDRE